jgi:methylenetetrahydrofolate dehydrogenase (NADP+)/methenyltetrahydrofolate cyclohydrolase
VPSKTTSLEQEVGRADIVAASVGKPYFIQLSWIKDGAVVVDAGYYPGGIGDVDPSGLFEHCTP